MANGIRGREGKYTYFIGIQLPFYPNVLRYVTFADFVTYDYKMEKGYEAVRFSKREAEDFVDHINEKNELVAYIIQVSSNKVQDCYNEDDIAI